MENFDLIVVGGGKAGKSLAMNRAKHGWKVALIERQFIGGTCINVACIPTKRPAMIPSSVSKGLGTFTSTLRSCARTRMASSQR